MGNGRRSESHGSGDAVPMDVIPLHSTNLLTVLDADGTIRYESPSITRVYGFDQAELVGDHVGDHVHPDDRERVLDAFRTLVSSEQYTTEAVEYRHERADGTYAWVESVSSADPTPNGRYVVNTRDVSDRKERERRLEAANERLETFASVVSHDLRNPLAVARGRLRLAAEECESEHLADVERAHERMESLIDELLTLARDDGLVAHTETVALGDLVESCWETVPTGDATLVTDVDERIRADPGRLRQLLENLVRNSVEHGSTGNRRSNRAGDSVEHGSTDSRPEADDDGAVTVTVGALDTGFYVEDDGPGIPPDERGRVFDVGYSTTSAGTGLGLSIVDRVAEAHGWAVEVTEGTDGGARFEVTGVTVAE